MLFYKKSWIKNWGVISPLNSFLLTDTIKSKFEAKLIFESLNFKASNITPSLFNVNFKWFLSFPIKSYYTKDIFDNLKIGLWFSKP